MPKTPLMSTDELLELASGVYAATAHPHALLDLNDRVADSAVCSQTDPEQFFQEKGGCTRAPKAVCNGTSLDGKRKIGDPCPVRRDCLILGLARGDRFGILGGQSERERRNLDRQLVPFIDQIKAAAAAAKEAAAAEQAEPARAVA